MAENLSNRPAGGREGDFGELNDWTITDIATAPKTAPEDRKNAEAEIARREEAGTYDPDNAPQEVRSDLLSHGYGVDNGKVLYPKPEYKSWLESDREKPIPSGVIRESIEDRLEAERQATKEAQEARENAKIEQRREFNKATGEAAIEAYENSPTREKINHPSRSTKERDEITREREAKEKSKDVEIASRRKFKESNKYNNNFLNPEKAAAAEEQANMSIYEVVETPSERTKSPESVEERAEKLFNYYESNFKKEAPRWVSFGVSSQLEKGIINPPTDLLLRSGFWSREEDRIHERIDPEDTLTAETIDAEAELKTRVSKDLIGEKSQEIPNDELNAAKRGGMLHAILSGARVDNRSGKVTYSIPFEQGNEVIKFMNDIGFELNDPDDENLKLIKASYQGFANIIEAIKNNSKETKKGFEALDWYFDSFNYKERVSDFLDVMNAYQEKTDSRWTAKFEEYLDSRDEIKKYLKQSEQKPIPELTQVEEITEEQLRKMYEDLVRDIAQQPSTLHLFPDIEKYPIFNHTGAVPPVNMPPTSVQKLGKVVTEFAKLKAIDPYANIYKGVFIDSAKKKKHYMIIRYGVRNSNVAIAVPIEDMSNDSSYTWVGQTGDNREGWREAFVQNPDPNIPTSKYQAHHREDVRAHNHIAAMKTRGLNATDNMWYNIYKDIEMRAI